MFRSDVYAANFYDGQVAILNRAGQLGAGERYGTAAPGTTITIPHGSTQQPVRLQMTIGRQSCLADLAGTRSGLSLPKPGSMK